MREGWCNITLEWGWSPISSLAILIRWAPFWPADMHTVHAREWREGLKPVTQPVWPVWLKSKLLDNLSHMLNRTVPLARNFPWHASDALSIRASVLKLCTRQLRVRKNLHMHVAGASIASQFLLFEVCTWGFSDNRTRIKLSKGHGKWTVQPEISQLRLRNVFV